MHRTFLLVILSLALAACAGRRSHVKPQTGRVQPQTLGTISMVNEDLGFVLINTGETPNPGTKLNALSPTGEETATLTVSPEQKRPFIIADIVNGTPHSGDEVRLKPVPVLPPSSAH